MPAISRTARACALALAGLGLTASTLATSAQPAAAEPTQARTVARKVSERVLSARDIAMHQRGDLYAYGASGPDRFDCSGLVFFSYRRAGFSVPRTSSAQAGFTRRVAKSRMRTGDLMFFYGSSGVYHAAIFLRWSHGHAVMVHSPGAGQRVRVDVPWTSSWFGGTLRRR